ncbi:xanthine dehydrogenase family protein molybdopterin-binding subunit [Litorilinea aerophila]|uniref:Xanthine dehydrogenase family protein n=1 Tax=Litorilinea aerophila TaxID=1204385 RepID=A0A540VE46_9CHLR|nr:xanthine dehydrogenase family protein molybdopterin-binding subunit [Litorilinea aerophila]MCC9077290.1 xanthine dehydrogenase family protein molybdopterin-binding subunit [Litorilinea aerophila]
MRAVGSSLPRVDAVEKVTGLAAYPGDLDLPGQAWLKIVFAGVPHARIRRMDVSAARAAPGVLAVLTAADVPVNEYGLIMADQPVLCGLGSTPQAERVRWEADHVALVVAETPAQAAAAARLVQVDYEPLPVVTDPLEAMKPGAPILHPHEFNGYPYGQRPLDSNVLLSYRIQRGDVDAGFAQADVIVEGTYRTHAQEHAYLQPEAGLAFTRPDGRIEVICAGQWMHEDRRQIAHALGLPEEQIVVRYPAIGGAFGGREDLSVQIALALATWKTGRPVKIVWSREESIIGHHKRHPFIFRAKWGATRDGRIVAAQVDVTSDAGAYAYTSTKVLGNATMACLGPYQIPNVLVESRTVYTNNCPSGAFRGFGGPQGHFAAEMQVNKLAEALGMDPVELRLRNIWRDGAILPTRSVVPAGCSAAQVLEEAARRGGWRQDQDGHWHRADQPTAGSGPERPFATSLDASRSRVARGKGIAVCFKNVGFSLGAPESCAAWVELHGGAHIERAIVGCVGADVGQGAHTVFMQMAAEVLGIDPALVELQVADSDVAPSSGSASASRMTFMAGNAIRGAALRALEEWQGEERPARGEYIFRPRPTTPYAPETGEADPNITYGYCAQVAEVEVDLETGHVTVTRLVSVNDVGRAINPQQVEGQIEGAVAQSIGWTLMEEFIQEKGRTVTRHLSTYLIPGVLDVPTIVEPVILEVPDPQGPLGARGMAEMPFIPTAPAIGAAIHDAIGVWIDRLPYTPERVWAALQAQSSSSART